MQTSDCDGDSTNDLVSDELTGLVWARYAGAPTIGSCTGGLMNWQDALDYVGCLNSISYLGQSDWRLPNINELKSLVNLGQSNTLSWLITEGFTNIQSGNYWSSTSAAVDTSGMAWAMEFNNEIVDYDGKTNTYYAWPVRSGQSGTADPTYPSNIPGTGQIQSYYANDDGDLHTTKGVNWPLTRFTVIYRDSSGDCSVQTSDCDGDSTNDLVKDELTGLIWTRHAGTPTAGSCTGGLMHWTSGTGDPLPIAYVNCLNTINYLGHNDWRLPNINELHSLIDHSEYNPALFALHPFYGVQSTHYWSSTAHTGIAADAWSVDFYGGGVYYEDRAPGSYVWPVRGLTHSPPPVDNPMKGFMAWDSQSSYSSNFPHSLEFFYIPLKDLMTGFNTYTWNNLDTRIAAIAARGYQTVFRVYLDYPQMPPATPTFLVNMGVAMYPYTEFNNGTVSYPGQGVSLCPDYNDPNLQLALTNFIAALGARYDGDPRVAFIPVGLLGFWGEWHTFGRPDLEPPSTLMDIVLNAFETAFPTMMLTVREPKPNVNTNHPRLGYEDDSFSYDTLGPITWKFWPKVLSAGMGNVWMTRPIGGEVRPEVSCSLWDDAISPTIYSLCPTWTPTVPVPSDQLYNDCVDTTHASWLSYTGAFEPPVNTDPIKHARAAAGSRRLGYELYVSQSTLQPVTASGILQGNITIENTGVAPFYYPWTVMMGALDSSGNLTTWNMSTTSWDLRTILPGLSTTWSFNVQHPFLPAGSYKLLMAVPNIMTNGIPIRFANTTQDQDVSGWLTLGAFRVTSGSGGTFGFTPQTGVARNTSITSNAITISGLSGPTAISLSSCTSTLCEYSINGVFTSVAGTVHNGDSVMVRQTSSSNCSATTAATLTVGSISSSFSVATLLCDTTPNPFMFNAVTGVAPNAPVTSNSVTVTGINMPASISITSTTGAYGMYSISNVSSGGFTGLPGQVVNGSVVRVRLHASSSYGTPATATLDIGGVTSVFSVTTVSGLGVSYTITPSAGQDGAISPSTPQTVTPSGTSSFTLTPDPGFHIGSVGGTCSGRLSGTTFTIQPATANCTVSVTFDADTAANTVPAGTGTVTPVAGTDITFSNGTTGGAITVTELLNSVATGNFSLLMGTSYDITFSGSFNPPATVCITYNPYAVSGNESDLLLLHRSGNTWTNITSQGYPNTTTHVICGLTPSFSEFAVAEPIASVAADGTMFVTTPGQADATCSSYTCNGSLNNGYKLNDASSPSFADGGKLYINWGDGTPIERHDPGGSYTHNYTHIGQYRVTQTVKDNNGNGSQRNWAINVTGGTNGKGTLKISASGSAYFNLSYNVMDGTTSVSSGTVAVGGSKSIILDAKTYSVKFTYQSKTPLTDPLTYHSCSTLPSGALTSSTGASVTVSSVTVPTGETVPVSLNDCND